MSAIATAGAESASGAAVSSGALGAPTLPTGRVGAASRTAEGRTRITTRALNRVVAAVAADALGVKANSVGVDLTDENGTLVVAVKSPLRVVSLRQVQDDPAIVGRTGGSLLQRATEAQQQIRRRAAHLTGSDISRVTVRLTGVDVQPERRVS